MEIKADHLDEKIRLLARMHGDTNETLAALCTEKLGRKISREYIRRLAVRPDGAGHIPEESADADVLAVLAYHWDQDLSDLSELAFDRSRRTLAVHGVIARELTAA